MKELGILFNWFSRPAITNRLEPSSLRRLERRWKLDAANTVVRDPSETAPFQSQFSRLQLTISHLDPENVHPGVNWQCDAWAPQLRLKFLKLHTVSMQACKQLLHNWRKAPMQALELSSRDSRQFDCAWLAPFRETLQSFKILVNWEPNLSMLADFERLRELVLVASGSRLDTVLLPQALEHLTINGVGTVAFLAHPLPRTLVSLVIDDDATTHEVKAQVVLEGREVVRLSRGLLFHPVLQSFDLRIEFRPCTCLFPELQEEEEQLGGRSQLETLRLHGANVVVEGPFGEWITESAPKLTTLIIDNEFVGQELPPPRLSPLFDVTSRSLQSLRLPALKFNPVVLGSCPRLEVYDGPHPTFLPGVRSWPALLEARLHLVGGAFEDQPTLRFDAPRLTHLSLSTLNASLWSIAMLPELSLHKSTLGTLEFSNFDELTNLDFLNDLPGLTRLSLVKTSGFESFEPFLWAPTLRHLAINELCRPITSTGLPRLLGQLVTLDVKVQASRLIAFVDSNEFFLRRYPQLESLSCDGMPSYYFKLIAMRAPKVGQ